MKAGTCTWVPLVQGLNHYCFSFVLKSNTVSVSDSKNYDFFQQPYSFGAFWWALELNRQSQLWESRVGSQLCVSFSCTGPKLWHFASMAVPFKSERGGMWCETEPHTPNWAVHGYQFHGSWQRWGHFPLILRSKIKLKRQFCTFWGCCAPAPCRRKAGDVVLIFQCAGGSDMFWALLEREQMLHNCSRKSRMLLYITDFPQCFGKDHWPKQMWKREIGIMKYVSIMNI